jgi:hypothetical protein
MAEILRASHAELLECTAEECAEVIQAIMKILRHGLRSRNPHQRGGETNIEHLSVEVGQLKFLLVELENYGLLDETHVIYGYEQKQKNLPEWTRHLIDSKLKPQQEKF